MEDEKLRILEMLGAGEITADQAAQLLAALEEPEAEAFEGTDSPSLSPADQMQSRWARFWVYPLMAGGIVLVVGALIMGLVYSTDTARGWLVCGWLPMILGLVVILIAWWTRSATWLHLRISEGKSKGHKVAFSFPLPLTLAAWALRVAQPFVPQLKDWAVDDLIIALRQGKSGNQPLFIDVQDDKDGERVQIYIG